MCILTLILIFVINLTNFDSEPFKNQQNYVIEFRRTTQTDIVSNSTLKQTNFRGSQNITIMKLRERPLSDLHMFFYLFFATLLAELLPTPSGS
ncbi:hypothetical protein J3Q64DRAFT_1777410 [Phycomyces blakesleeanus]|uniref:Uncharacterized protein n=1 Tax=Phycomyces blakesleeanus TaxID=4837 RepID=A0ABR3AIX4_PHYBL